MMEPIRLHHSETLSAEVEYAYAASVQASRLVFTAGACPLDQKGQISTQGYAAQAKICMQNLGVALTEAGSSLDQVLKTTVFVASDRREDLVEAWNEVRAAMGSHDAPSTLLGVAVLGYPGQLVEVEAVAVGSSEQ
ncbi:enamine deaminase RidA (YjgF/YER057c/UK114 family) [Psychromicrobium silvestre]|uniref:Enamine deaminase RidA (YjgF/YER057c/UK114 family) n=1 Tax=Psychromicrobium silvestre TaxID=1645614 RepID=A0A7Y9LRF8_9MICC|nr:RidA family protein [Psychromicrobium silvestre]NYE94225.1 enamine deaminase RidA (YjgF/YER057c/UK114 family) [Psychromicrobium silvestre]